jgi:cytochrome c biogenesis factor
VLQPLIITTETGDIYVHFGYTESLYNALVQALSGHDVTPDELAITVQTSPMVYLVWTGVALMLIGISFEFAGDWASLRRSELPISPD